MKPKYNIDDKLWTVSSDYGKLKVEQVTVGEVDLNTTRHFTDDRNGLPMYKMKEGCSYWRIESDLFDNKLAATVKCSELTEKKRVVQLLQNKSDQFWDEIPEKKILGDGIYDVTDISFYQLEEDDKKDKLDEIKLYMEQHPDFVIAHAYETYTTFILEYPPVKLHTCIGSGFNRGSTNIITDCPRSILLLAEDD
jgi:hypothetical protein